MKYQPITCVWEVTMGCNMRCGHCGSSCKEALPDELSTEEALQLCEELADLGIKWVTLSGGEPLTRKDILIIIRRLKEKGVAVNMITNGWLLNEETVLRLKESGISTVAVSIDGTGEIHDRIRVKGAFAHAKEAFAMLKKAGIRTGAITTITKQNIQILDELKEELIRIGVDSWQVQIGLPMGNLKERPDWVLEPCGIQEIIDFCYATAKEGRIKIFTTDCIGYYTKKELEIKRLSYGTDRVSPWDGCNAGIRGLGVLHNGDVLGCTSVRDRQYVEGNIRQRSLRDIWEDENSFSWRRKMTKEKLLGACGTCIYGSRCLGGCPNSRLTMNGKMDSENQYCAYHLALLKIKQKYESYTDVEELLTLAEQLLGQEAYQEAAAALKQALTLQPENMTALLLKGYAEYMCGNYELCRQHNEKVLAMDSQNIEALRGYAHALYKQGKIKEGISCMRRAAAEPGKRQKEFLSDLHRMEAEGLLI